MTDPQPPANAAASPVWMALATWFGTGLSPKAPGTVGSLGSFVLWAPLVLLEAPWWARLIAVVVVFVVGVVASDRVCAVRGEDPQIIVIDEVAGMGITLLFAGPSVAVLVVGFVCFRVFDIAKPWPVSWADQKIHGGLGVMLDDALAGVYALILTTVVVRYALPLLGIHS